MVSFLPLSIIWFSSMACKLDEENKNIEDALFDMFRSEEQETVPIGKFLAVIYIPLLQESFNLHPLFQALRTYGIRNNDPRIEQLMNNLRKVHKLSGWADAGSPEIQNLNRETFKAWVLYL